MADIDASLKKALDGPAPQHKVEGRQEFEFTEGKDGKLNVRDSELLSELELIKAQQTQILERLDGDFNTQLTGSIVELIKEHSYETGENVNAFFGETTSSSGSLGRDLDVSKYKRVIVFIKNDTEKELTFESVYFRIRDQEREFERVRGIKIDIPAGAETVVGTYEHEDIENTKYLKDILFPFLRVRTLNTSGLGDGKINVTFIGVKA